MNRQNDYLSILGYLLYIVIASSVVLGQASIASMFLSISYLWVCFIGVLSSKENLVPHHVKAGLVFTAIFASINVLLDGVINGSDLSFSYLKKVIMFIASLVWAIYCTYHTISKRAVISVLLFNLFLAYIYITHYQSGYMYDMESGHTYLYMNFPNSNTAGIFTSVCAIYMLLIAVYPFNKKILNKIKFLCIIPLALMIFITYLTGCRSALLCMMFVAMCVCMDKWIRKLQYFPKKLAIIWSLMPLLFLVIYLSYIDTLNIDFSMGLEEGKNNFTRLASWNVFLKHLYSSPILGSYYTASHGAGEFQCLNTHLDVLVSYGIIPFILFVRLLYVSVKDYSFSSASFYSRICLYAYLSMFITGCFEAALVSGSCGLFIAAFGFRLLANTDIKSS